jgi:hypothetical protein
VLSKINRIRKEKGLAYLPIAGFRRLKSRAKVSFWYNYFRTFKSIRTFTFQQKKYRYFYHRYNTTWVNERTVEIPIILNILKDFDGSILEVGNVLSHYFPVHHDVVDKYEKAEGVINVDVTEISLSKKYDLIICISTLEHVGWDEDPEKRSTLNEGQKIVDAVKKLRTLLNPKGKIVITAPVGYNPNLDALLRSNGLRFDKLLCLKRVSSDNKWVETTWKDIENAKFQSPFPFANGLVIGVIEG